MDKIISLISAALLIGFILWWFFSKRNDEGTEATLTDNIQTAEVTVNGGYLPNTVVFKQGVPAKITFNRKDPSNCFNEVVFPDFGIHKELPVNKAFDISIDTSKAGNFEYACGMNMFHGKVVIK